MRSVSFRRAALKACLRHCARSNCPRTERKSQHAIVLSDLAGVDRAGAVQRSGECMSGAVVWTSQNVQTGSFLTWIRTSRLPFERVTTAALMLRDLLGALDLVSFVKTTGGKGLHVVVPMRRTLTWDQASGFALGIARQLAARFAGSVYHQRFQVSSARQDLRRLPAEQVRRDRDCALFHPRSSHCRGGGAVGVGRTAHVELGVHLHGDKCAASFAASSGGPVGRNVGDKADDYQTDAECRAVR